MNSFDRPEPDRSGGLFGLSTRLPPSNIAAEQALLGALLANNKAYERVSEFLEPGHFADAIHGRIYTAISRRIENGQLADVVTLRQEFEHSGVLDEVGGPTYLAQLLSAMVGIINAGEYGKIVHDCWLRRQLVDIGETVVNRAFGTDDDPLEGKEQIEAAEQALFELASNKAGEGGAQPFDAALAKAVDAAATAMTKGGGVSGLSTGLRDLDARTGGLHRSDLLILAGRPGMGKTALATKIAFGAAKALLRETEEKHGPNAKPPAVIIFSLEMSAEQLANRLLSEESRIQSDRIRKGEISQREFDNFLQVSRELGRLPILIDDTPAISLSALRTRCRRIKRTRGLEFIVVDYLQLMRPSVGTRPESRVLEISMITQGLKAIAKELEVPVMALSQLSRQVEQREDKRPQLSDLRESGSIEQDADAVMFVYRDEYYLKAREPKIAAFENDQKFQDAMERWQQDMERAHNKAELYLAKQRHGPTGKIDLFFEAEYTRFGDLDQVHSSSPYGD
jgi:replicative DNA helicase